MKTLYFAAILLFTITFQLEAQTKIGVYTSVDNSSFSGEGTRNIDYYFGRGFVVGLQLKFPIAEDVFLSLEPAYFQGNNGISERDTIDLEVVHDHPVTNRSISLPIKLNIYFAPRWYAVGGFDFSYFISADLERFDNTIDISSEFSSFNLSALFGIGHRFPIKRSDLLLEFAYLQGLNNLSTNDHEDGYLRRVRTTSTRLSVIYLIPLGKSNE